MIKIKKDGEWKTISGSDSSEGVQDVKVDGTSVVTDKVANIDLTGKADISYVDTQVATKQDTLVSGTNIKTINSQSILGEGDINITSISAAGCGIRLYKDISLPEEYQRIESIMSNGTQVIETELFAPDNFDEMLIDCSFNDLAINEYSMHGNCGAGRLPKFSIGVTYNGDYYYGYGDTESNMESEVSYTQGTRLIWHAKEREFWVKDLKGNVIATAEPEGTLSPDATQVLFGWSDNERCVSVLYGCKFYLNGAIVRNFIPCYRKEDNHTGLFDVITDTFYESSGDEFVKGDILPEKTINVVTDNKTIKVNHLNELEVIGGSSSGVRDVKVNGTSVVTDNIANINLNTKQDKLVSGTNIKTINGNSLLGSGDISISGGASSDYTYVVDSNQKLANWANNVAGNDYTAVLIKPGTWTSTVGINLTTSGTKSVTGLGGSILEFTGSITSCIKYNSMPTSAEYWMKNVIIRANDLTASGIVFENCPNLVGCKTIGKAGIGYDRSYYLVGCESRLTKGIGFTYCRYLTNCNVYCRDGGYQHCYYLSTCQASAQGDGTSSQVIGFYDCHYITSCYSMAYNSYSAGGKILAGYRNCSGITSSVADASNGSNESSAVSYGFYSCNRISNCATKGSVTRDSITGYGFIDCKQVTGCYAMARCANGVYNTSYSIAGTDSTYSCANTPNGGFNDTTNPSY